MNKIIDRFSECRIEVTYSFQDIKAEGAIVSTGLEDRKDCG